MFCKLFRKKQKTTETSLIESFYYPKLGPGQLWELVAQKIEANGGKIFTNSRVVGIDNKGDRINSVVYELGGKKVTLEGDIFISTMPVRDLVDALSEKPIDVERVANGLPYRDFMTVGLLLNKMKLQNKTQYKTLGNIVPDCWIYVQDTSVKLGRIQVFNNWSPYFVKDPENTVWLGLEYFCNEGDELWSMSDGDAVALAIQELETIGVIDSADVLDSHRELIKKAYPAYFDTHAEIKTVTQYLDTIENLYCIGRNGQHRYNNMDHSMVTAFEAVKNIQNGVVDKSNIWSVNTEKEYHEEK